VPRPPGMMPAPKRVLSHRVGECNGTRTGPSRPSPACSSDAGPAERGCRRTRNRPITAGLNGIRWAIMGNYGRQRDASRAHQLGRCRLASGKLKEELKTVGGCLTAPHKTFKIRSRTFHCDLKTTYCRFPAVFFAGACKSPCRSSVIF
jgi:hypothetical protein